MSYLGGRQTFDDLEALETELELDVDQLESLDRSSTITSRIAIV